MIKNSFNTGRGDDERMLKKPAPIYNLPVSLYLCAKKTRITNLIEHKMRPSLYMAGNPAWGGPSVNGLDPWLTSNRSNELARTAWRGFTVKREWFLSDSSPFITNEKTYERSLELFPAYELLFIWDKTLKLFLCIFSLLLSSIESYFSLLHTYLLCIIISHSHVSLLRVSLCPCLKIKDRDISLSRVSGYFMSGHSVNLRLSPCGLGQYSACL